MHKPTFEFSDYTLLTARQEIAHRGEALPVEPKVYDFILYLLERRDRVVTKEELQEAIWPKVIVTESALTRVVMKARHLVGDDGKCQRIIKTVHSRGYQFVETVTEGVVDYTAAVTAAGDTERMSIAVLPFRNLSDEQAQAFLAEGLTQDIITDLSRNTWLIVVGRTSSEAYRREDIDHRTVSCELGARYLVEGSVRRVRDHVRICASLTDAATAATEWSERYDQSIDDFFEIQDEITHSIVASLGSHVRRAEAKRAARADPAALDVWGLLHRGMAISWSRFNRQSNCEAEGLYRQALARAPGNPRAMAFLAWSVAMKVANGWSEDVERDCATAWDLGAKALEQEPEDPMILLTYGHLNASLGQAAKAVDIIERALEIDPSSSWGLGLLAFALTGVGRAEEALGCVSKALRLSPRDAATHWFLAMYAWAYLQLGQFEDAAREAQRSINSFAGWQPPWATLAVARAALGQWEDATEAAEVAARLEPVVDGKGFARFFGFLVQGGERAREIAGWLDRIWPEH